MISRPNCAGSQLTIPPEQDWPAHKAFCKMTITNRANLPVVKGFEDSEPPLRRNLRHFTSRFNNSLMFAAITALDLMNRPERIDTHGVLIMLRPRPHANTGARFFMESGVPMSIAEIKALTPGGQTLIPDQTWNMHQAERARLRKQSNGKEDFATMLVIARNEGPTPIPGDDHALEMRYEHFLLLAR